jgi:transposase
VTAKDNRLFVEAVLYRYRAGIPWRDLPERFGPDWKVVRTRHLRWAESGVRERVFKALAADADNEYTVIGSTTLRAHQHNAGARKKAWGRRSRRVQQGRTEHQEQGHCRRAGQPRGLPCERRPGPRSEGSDVLPP